MLRLSQGPTFSTRTVGTRARAALAPYLAEGLEHVAGFIVNPNHSIMRDNLHIHTLIPPKITRASALGHSGKW
jgi:hypothetical protein